MESLQNAARKIGEKNLHCLIILAICAIEISTHWGYWYPDSGTYVSAMNYIIGEEEVLTHEKRMIRPVTLVLAAPLSSLIGVIDALALINAVFWIATSLLLYHFSYGLLNDRRLALYPALMFTTSTTMLEYGTAVLTDSGGYFFTLLTFYILHLYRDSEDMRTYVMLGVILTIGALTREQVIPFFFIYLFIYEYLSGNKRWKRIFYITALVGFLVMGYYILADIDPFTAYISGKTHAKNFSQSAIEVWGPTVFIKTVLGAFAFFPLLAIFGIYHEKNRENHIRYLAMFLAVFFVLVIWPINDYRFTFLLFPIVFPLASLGMKVFYLKLCKLSIFSKLDIKVYKALTIVVYAILMNYYAYLKKGFQLVFGV